MYRIYLLDTGVCLARAMYCSHSGEEDDLVAGPHGNNCLQKEYRTWNQRTEVLAALFVISDLGKVI